MLELNKIYQGDCLEVMKTFPDNSVDSIVTDPPYELGFMGKSWDKTGIANNKEMWAECLRVLKHGGHLLSFSGTRTYHRMASAIEDAGFEVRDMIEWVYGSGFPKSLNVQKQLQKMGSERAEEFAGVGTALKPAHEPICMARKPLSEKTVAENCLKYGTGGINIDDSRVGTNPEVDDMLRVVDRNKRESETWENGSGFKNENNSLTGVRQDGRFPANLIHDGSEEVRECFPETKPSKKRIVKDDEILTKENTVFETSGYKERFEGGMDDNGGNASRFFKSIIYQAKASRSERNYGCEELEDKPAGMAMKDDKFTREHMGNTPACDREPVKNNHPTVKPIALMEYLIKMVTPKGGIVLDPFAGSGTTLISAKLEGYNFIGIELSEEYCKIAEARIKKAKISRSV